MPIQSPKTLLLNHNKLHCTGHLTQVWPNLSKLWQRTESDLKRGRKLCGQVDSKIDVAFFSSQQQTRADLQREAEGRDMQSHQTYKKNIVESHH